MCIVLHMISPTCQSVLAHSDLSESFLQVFISRAGFRQQVLQLLQLRVSGRLVLHMIIKLSVSFDEKCMEFPHSASLGMPELLMAH